MNVFQEAMKQVQPTVRKDENKMMIKKKMTSKLTN